MKRRVLPKKTVVQVQVIKSTKALPRTDIAKPVRSSLTKKQWLEYGDLRKCLKVRVPGIVGSSNLSLSDLRDVYYSTKICTLLRVSATK